MKRLNHIWYRTNTHRGEIFCIYLFQLVFSLLIGGVVYMIINKFFGKSVALDQLAKGFDRTVIMDAINSNDKALTAVTNWMKPLFPIYLLLSIILQGGYLHNIRKGEIGITTQIRNGVKNFIPFLSIGFISLLLVVIMALAIGVPFAMFVGDPLTTFSSEKPFVLSIIGLIMLFTIWLVLVWAWSISSRLSYVSDRSFWISIKRGFSTVRHNLLDLLAVGYLFLGLQVLLSFIYYLIMGDRGAPSWTIVIFGIIVQQIFSFLRVYLRGMAYISVEQIEDEII